MKTRIISAIVIIGPLLVFFFLGGVPLLVFCFLLSGVGMHEFYKGYSNIDVHPGRNWAYALLIGLYLIPVYHPFQRSASVHDISINCLRDSFKSKVAIVNQGRLVINSFPCLRISLFAPAHLDDWPRVSTISNDV